MVALLFSLILFSLVMAHHFFEMRRLDRRIDDLLHATRRMASQLDPASMKTTPRGVAGGRTSP